MKQRKWKVMFILLLSLNIFLIGFIVVNITQPNESSDELLKRKTDTSEPIELVTFTKKNDLNVLINRYINEELIDRSISYKINLMDNVSLTGTIPIFSNPVQFKMVFKPMIVEKGDLLLQLESAQLGRLNIPVSIVLTTINDLSTLPQWIKIRPKERSIYLAVTNIETKGMKFKVRTFDLEKDDISFSVFIPEK